MTTKRRVLEELKRDELIAAVERFELPVADRRVRDLLVAALASSRRARLREILEDLKRDRLKELCRAVGLDDRGRGKAALVARLTGKTATSMVPSPWTAAGDRAARSKAGREPSARPGRFADLEKRLRASNDPLDALSLSLLGPLERHDRLTFTDALARASEKGMSDLEAFMALERLARPGTAGLRRYYIDHSAGEPRFLTPGEVREQFVAPRSRSEREEWMSSVEVAWAESEEKALGEEGAS